MNLQKLKYIKRLVRLSNALDFVGEFKRAGIIDRKIEKIAAKRKYEEDPDQLSLFDDLEPSEDSESEESDFELSEDDRREVDEIEEYFTEEYDFPTFDEDEETSEYDEIPDKAEIKRKFYSPYELVGVEDFKDEEESEDEDSGDLDFEINSFEMEKEDKDSGSLDFDIESFDLNTEDRGNAESDLDFDIESFPTGDDETSYELYSEEPLFGGEPEPKGNPAKEYHNLIKELENSYDSGYMDSEE